MFGRSQEAEDERRATLAGLKAAERRAEELEDVVGEALAALDRIRGLLRPDAPTRDTSALPGSPASPRLLLSRIADAAAEIEGALEDSGRVSTSAAAQLTVAGEDVAAGCIVLFGTRQDANAAGSGTYLEAQVAWDPETPPADRTVFLARIADRAASFPRNQPVVLACIVSLNATGSTDSAGAGIVECAVEPVTPDSLRAEARTRALLLAESAMLRGRVEEAERRERLERERLEAEERRRLAEEAALFETLSSIS
ncbi:hypothetical protein DFJ74DRAFT_710377 [Hyaloraphidium curvatum]|nr:hypothetical protein DFJ74DRAFT_710377 [Hyaloraphidium curvatum]